MEKYLEGTTGTITRWQARGCMPEEVYVWYVCSFLFALKNPDQCDRLAINNTNEGVASVHYIKSNCPSHMRYVFLADTHQARISYMLRRKADFGVSLHRQQ